ncbi:DUF5995 family protein [Ferruginibacter paludis]|uniref:DUF5995 family protein n=1 Tax=Ferruginibacter paludis TaxID=1310417 RepID=UPI0025B48775|nr:DUF5995 family protein [Ferruginibacter paludis]MDN3657252.1 DUF5995 family protein [Ferruginibacter paludis]
MPVTTIAEVIDQLTNIVGKAAAENNRAGYFATLYKKVTIAVYDKIKAGYFDDNERMEKLDVVFACRYLDAYQEYTQHKKCSACWQFAFDACNAWQPMVMHHLLLGMNAHIGLDLGIAAAIVSPGGDIENIHTDFNKINTILCDLIAEVKASLFSMWPLSKFISQLNMGQFENDLAGFSMHIARDAAWQSALDYNAGNGITEKENYIIARDRSVTDFSNQILHPGAAVKTLSAIFRLFEFGTVADKIKKLDVHLL